jgi:hypothetical protein
VLVQSGRTSPALHAARMLDALRANREVLLALARSPEEAGLRGLVPLPGPLERLALGRFAWSTDRDELFLDRPNVLAAHARVTSFDASGADGESSIDVVHHGLATRAPDVAQAFDLRLRQGVLESFVEELAHGCCGDHENAARLARACAEQDVGWRVVCPAEAVNAWDCAAVEPEIRARVLSDLEAGFLVALPEAEVLEAGRPVLGYWRIDPVSGDTLAIGPHGWGQDTMFDFAGALGPADLTGDLLCERGAPSAAARLAAALSRMTRATHGGRPGAARDADEAVDAFLAALAAHVLVELSAF